MQKKLKNKLDNIEKEQLVEIIESLCTVKETERMLNLMIAPTKAEIDRALRNVSRSAEVYVCNSCSSRMVSSLQRKGVEFYFKRLK